MTDIDLTAAIEAGVNAYDFTNAFGPEKQTRMRAAISAALPHILAQVAEGELMSYYECCASGSCEVCRRPTGYTQRQREEMLDYEPPWVRQHDREGWIR